MQQQSSRTFNLTSLVLMNLHELRAEIRLTPFKVL